MKYLFLLALVPFLLTACTEPGETWYVEACGDGTCGGAEDCSSCEEDCGACPTCGDDSCNGDEDCSSCDADCGVCPTCGDETCNGDEDCSSCEDDCGVCPDPVCGDGACDVGEDADTCPADCAEAGPCIDFDTALAIFDGNACLGCHTGTGSGGLDLSGYEGFLNGGTNGAAYADADGAVSNIVTKLKTDTNPFGSVMPLGNADSVSDDDIQSLIDWIDGGVVEACAETACGDGTCDAGEDETSCPDDCAPEVPCVDFSSALAVFDGNSCLGCHTGTGSGGLDLSGYEGFIAGGTNGAAYEDSDGAVSNIVTKLKTDTNPFGSVMPLGKPDTVPDADIQILIDWIDGGTNETCE